MADYTDAAEKWAEDRNKYDKEYAEKYGLEYDKEYEVRRQNIAKAVAKVLENRGYQPFKYEDKQIGQAIFDQMVQDGTIISEKYEGSEKSHYVFADKAMSGRWTADQIESLSGYASQIAAAKLEIIKEQSKENVLNNGLRQAVKSLTEHVYSYDPVEVTMKLTQRMDSGELSQKYSLNDAVSQAPVTAEVSGKAVLSEEEFKSMLQERVQNAEKEEALKAQYNVNSGKDGPVSQYYGDGLVAQGERQNGQVGAVKYTVDGQEVDKDSFQKMVNIVNAQKYNEQQQERMTAAVQHGSVISIYNPDTKGPDGLYSEIQHMVQQADGSYKYVTAEEAKKVLSEEKAQGKDISAHKLKNEYYGGGLHRFETESGKEIFMNTKNVIGKDNQTSNTRMASAKTIAVQNKMQEGR